MSHIFQNSFQGKGYQNLFLLSCLIDLVNILKSSASQEKHHQSVNISIVLANVKCLYSCHLSGECASLSLHRGRCRVRWSWCQILSISSAGVGTEPGILCEGGEQHVSYPGQVCRQSRRLFPPLLSLGGLWEGSCGSLGVWGYRLSVGAVEGLSWVTEGTTSGLSAFLFVNQLEESPSPDLKYLGCPREESQKRRYWGPPNWRPQWR